MLSSFIRVFFVVFAFSLLIGLGIWQLDRAHQKKFLLHKIEARAHQPITHPYELLKKKEFSFFPAQLEGSFDYTHKILLDNKTKQGRAGYELYIPFKIKGLDYYILVDTGWTPFLLEYQILPSLTTTHEHTVSGILHLPPAYFALGGFQRDKETQWPLRVEYLDLQKIGNLLGYQLFPYVLCQEVCQVITITPAKHIAYAVQWFCLALALGVMVFIIYRNRNSL